MKHYF
jgi:hypothetical protein